jgi:hypothetical protein
LLPVVWFVVPFVGLVAVSVVKPMMEGRYLTPAIPGLVLLVCIVVDRWRDRGAVIMVGVLLLSLPAVRLTLTKEPIEDYRSATRYITESAAAGDAVLMLRSVDPVIQYYWRRASESPDLRPLNGPADMGDVRRVNAAQYRPLGDASTAWVVEHTGADELTPGEVALLREIQERMEVVDEREFGVRLIVTEYRRRHP